MCEEVAESLSARYRRWHRQGFCRYSLNIVGAASTTRPLSSRAAMEDHTLSDLVLAPDRKVFLSAKVTFEVVALTDDSCHALAAVPARGHIVRARPGD